MHSLTGTLTHFSNPNAHPERLYTDKQRGILSVKSAQDAIQDITQWPHYAATPLHHLDTLSSDAGLGKLWYKDESQRFGLKSFKALGGAYAVAKQLQQVLAQRYGKTPSITELLAGDWKSEIAEITVSCATDGNHGRSVSWGAQMFGCECIIYIHKDVSEGRRLAMESYGAKVIRIEGNYDESVRLADSEAKEHGRIIVSDTSYEGYMDIPKDVALGYTVMLAEIVEQLKGEIPTHVFIQGGVGGLASAVCGYFWDLWGTQRPRFLIVEPEQANCLQQSAKAGEPVTVHGSLETLMAGLACGEVSSLAWEILAEGANDFLTLSEDAIPQTMKMLASGESHSEKIEAGESAVPGLAAVLIARSDTELAKTIELNSDSRVLVIGTEGATDPDLYKTLIS
ncbi:diaminopropionate ammonia-lyase [Vibrio penaeicida]|uniref:diaminopropionate ammonia-lyase n=1 Tax=Vibrio penaeicida TaxID=104609 RepID=UPI002736E7B0|nr:diaminopropionate ammonia-lyase [Vibrio penaeicida]MDP2572538.1 diaminopropionate ammonia-lyase [Vibrio penaeicida]